MTGADQRKDKQMIKVASILLVAYLAVASANTGYYTPSAAGPPATHPWLKFKDGKFRILQIADVHYQNGATTPCQDILDYQLPCSDKNSTDFLTALIQREKPDLAIFTGDNIWYTNNTDIVKHQAELTKPLNDAKIPYMLTFGNHDCEDQDCRPALIKADETQPYSLTVNSPKELHGAVNYAYSITDKSGNPAFALYVFDGGAYDSRMPGSYDWIRADQVDWYNKTSRALKAKTGKTIPAAAFFHIPVPEYDTAFTCNNKSKNAVDGTQKDFGVASKSGMGKPLADGCNQFGVITGVHQEGVYSANINGGLFSAFIDNGDVKMTNVGHDHINDYCASLYSVRLCYGGGFGYHAYGKAGWPRRARIIDIYEDGTITTYKTLDKWGGYKRVDKETF